MKEEIKGIAKKEEEIVIEVKKEFKLPKKVVWLKPNPRVGMHQDPNHVMYFMGDLTKRSWVLPRNGNTLSFIKCLTDEELEYCQKLLGVDLSFYKKTDNFWSDFKVTITKDDATMKSGWKFDLSDVQDYLRYKLLLIQPDIAASPEEKFDRPSYIFYFQDEGEEILHNSRALDETIEAYKFLSKIKPSTKKLINFLKVYGATKEIGRKIPDNSDKEWLAGEVNKIIETDIKTFLLIANDIDYDSKVFLMDAIDCGAIKREGRKYKLPGGDFINPTNPSFVGTIERLGTMEKEQDEAYLLIKQRIENSKN